MEEQEPLEWLHGIEVHVIYWRHLFAESIYMALTPLVY